MNVALLVALLVPLQADSKQTIGNASALTTNDWSDDFYVLSLRQSSKWATGTAWFMRFDEDGLQAWKGDYRVVCPDKNVEDTTLLQLGFTRHYIVIADRGKEQWQLDRHYEPKGMTLELSLENGDIPEKEMTLSVIRAFFVDDRGNETTKETAPRGFLQKLAGHGDERTVHELDTVKIGTTLQLRNDKNFYKMTKITDFLPPGFKLRGPASVEHRVSKPTPPTAKDYFDPLVAAVNKGPSYAVTAKSIAEQIIRFPADDVDAYTYRALAYRVLKQWDDAIRDYNKILALQPDSAFFHSKRAAAYEGRRSFREAADDHMTALRLAPEDPSYLNNAAWFLATCPDKKFRDGKTAVKYASKACELATDKDFPYDDTLAAAYAETGDFAKAVEVQTKALKTATETYRTEMEQRLALYQSGKPFRK